MSSSPAASFANWALVDMCWGRTRVLGCLAASTAKAGPTGPPAAPAEYPPATPRLRHRCAARPRTSLPPHDRDERTHFPDFLHPMTARRIPRPVGFRLPPTGADR